MTALVAALLFARPSAPDAFDAGPGLPLVVCYGVPAPELPGVLFTYHASRLRTMAVYRWDVGGRVFAGFADDEADLCRLLNVSVPPRSFP
jgi:hypothetical protein